jgi:hypothetical protein
MAAGCFARRNSKVSQDDPSGPSLGADIGKDTRGMIFYNHISLEMWSPAGSRRGPTLSEIGKLDYHGLRDVIGP